MIVQILVNDKALLEKYNKLIKRNQLMLDPNIQLSKRILIIPFLIIKIV